MLADMDILAGKLALGRGYVSREVARRIAAAVEEAHRQGRPASFLATGVQLGLLATQYATALTQLLEHGVLLCRGTCGKAQPLHATRAAQTLRCLDCGGPVYVSLSGSHTVMKLDVPPARIDGPNPLLPVAEPATPSPGFTFLELDVPDTPLAQPVDALEAAGVDWASAPTNLGPAYPPTAIPTPHAATTKYTDQDRETFAAASGETTLKMAHTPGGEFVPFRVTDDVEAEAPLGRGAGGHVLRGRRVSNGEPVAIKILGKPNDPDALARFNREVMIGGRLGHPGIVQVFDTGTLTEGRWQGHPYCLMEFVAGRDVDAWASEAPRDVHTCVQLVAEACDAIHYAHGKGVIHRDLKPGNILVRREDDAPVLCDFGLSKYRRDAQNTTDIPGGAKTKVGVILGTPSYMSPEQARGDLGIGPAADVYGIGAVLFRLLTGDPPFRGQTPFETIKQVVRDKPKPPSRLNPQVPPALDAILLQCLAKQPLKRFHGIRPLREALLALNL